LLYLQHFGNTLNVHPHFHILVADGIFNIEGENLKFHETYFAPDAIADIQENIRHRVLKFFKRKGFFEQDDLEKMLKLENSGFSLDAKVRIESRDREGLERLIRYCARPPFASENLRWKGPWISYRLPKPSRTGQTFIQIDPMEFLERISAFIPFPRHHRRHYHGAFAPNSRLRKKIADSAQKRQAQMIPEAMQEVCDKVEKVSFNWAKLIARIYETDPLICTMCGKTIKIIAFVTHTAEIRRILRGIGWNIEVPEFDPAHDMHNWDIWQLSHGTKDGFSEVELQVHFETGPDPPHMEYFDPPHWEDRNEFSY
jgi:Putative transposase